MGFRAYNTAPSLLIRPLSASVLGFYLRADRGELCRAWSNCVSRRLLAL